MGNLVNLQEVYLQSTGLYGEYLQSYAVCQSVDRAVQDGEYHLTDDDLFSSTASPPGTIPPSIKGLVKITAISLSATVLSGTAPVALLKLCQSTSAGGGGASCAMKGLKLLLPSDMSGLVDLTGLDLSNWGIEGERLQRYLAPVSLCTVKSSVQARDHVLQVS